MSPTGYRWIKPCRVCYTRNKSASSAYCHTHRKPWTMSAAQLANLRPGGKPPVTPLVVRPPRPHGNAKPDLSTATIETLLRRSDVARRRWRSEA